MTNIQQFARQCLDIEAQAINNLKNKIDDDFDRAVNLVLNCKGRLIVTGVGKSGHCGQKIAATLASTGTPSFFVNPLDAYHGDLGMFTSSDVVLAISYSGATDELLRFIPMLQERNIPIIAMTGCKDSLLARYAVTRLNIEVEREADPLNLAPTASTTATLAMGDALASALIRLRHFTASDFAQYHPGGSLGRRLLAKVSDFMVTANLPVVSPDDMLSDTIYEVSRGKLGIAVVMDHGSIAGVITDGDIRRATQNHKSRFFDLTAGSIMTHNPKTINQQARLAKAESMMRKYCIHDLVVVDDQNKLVGLIDYFSVMQ